MDENQPAPKTPFKDPEIQSMIAKVDWDLYNKRVTHSLSAPICPFYDGDQICPTWRGWVLSGKDLYNNQEEYVLHIIDRHPSIPRKDLTNILSSN